MYLQLRLSVPLILIKENRLQVCSNTICIPVAMNLLYLGISLNPMIGAAAMNTRQSLLYTMRACVPGSQKDTSSATRQSVHDTKPVIDVQAKSINDASRQKEECIWRRN